MNGASHYIVAMFWMILIYKIFEDKKFTNNILLLHEYHIKSRSFTNLSIIRIFITFIFNFYFHIIVDILSDMTYHPSNTNWGNTIYLVWHLFTYIAELTFAIYVFKKDLRYFWALLGSVGFDLWDWSIVRFIGKYFNVELPGIHHIIEPVYNLAFSWIPNYRMIQAALFIEVIFFISIFILWKKLQNKYPLQGEMNGSIKQVSILIIIFGLWRLIALF